MLIQKALQELEIEVAILRRPRIPHCFFQTRPQSSPEHGSKRNGKSHLWRSEEHTSELQSLAYLVCRLLLEKKKKKRKKTNHSKKQDTIILISHTTNVTM